MHHIPSPDNSDAGIERAIEATAAVAPRVRPTDVEAAIAEEHYFTAAAGVHGHHDLHETTNPGHHLSLGLLTICVLVLRNGFTVLGQSACASPENFDADIGKRVARQNAMGQVWPLLGFQLRDRLHNLDATFPARVVLSNAAGISENNAPAWDKEGNPEQAAVSRGNAESCRKAIELLGGAP